MDQPNHRKALIYVSAPQPVRRGVHARKNSKWLGEGAVRVVRGAGRVCERASDVECAVRAVRACERACGAVRCGSCGACGACGVVRLDSYGLDSYGLDSYGLDSYGPDSYGLDSYGLDNYGLDSYGLESYGLDASGVMALCSAGWCCPIYLQDAG